MTILAKNIRYLRKQKKLTQDELAEQLGYKSYTTIQKWESGKSEPTMTKFKQLASMWNVDMHDIATIDLELQDNYKFATSQPSANSNAVDAPDLNWQPELTKKDEKDIAVQLEKMIQGLNDGSYAAFDGKAFSELDDGEQQNLAAVLEGVLISSKIRAKQKFTPNKHKQVKDGDSDA